MAERTYHDTSSAYCLPNDAPEHTRLNYQARAVNAMMHDQPIQAPLTNPSRILDVGCGTGLITHHLSQNYPSAQEVIGLDLSPVPPQDDPNQHQPPSKATFLQGDFFDLTNDSPDGPTSGPHPALQPSSFDYIFSRLLIYGMTNWPLYLARAYALLRPGGQIELQEAGTIYLTSTRTPLPTNTTPWNLKQRRFLASRGVDVDCAQNLPGYLAAAGFADITVRDYRWVIGKWPGHPETDMLGEFASRTMHSTLRASDARIFPHRTEEEIAADDEQRNAAFAWSEEGKHIPWKVVYARKPLA